MLKYYGKLCSRAFSESAVFLREHVGYEVTGAVGLLIFALLFLPKDTQTEIADSTAFVLGPLAGLVLGVFLINLVRAPNLISEEQLGRIDALQSIVADLEEAAKSKLAIECKQESGLRLRDDRACLAYVEVRNLHGGQVHNAYARVQVIEHENASHGGGNPYRQRLFRHQDVFLKWQATDERLYSFHAVAILQVAYGRAGGGGFKLVSLGDALPQLHTSSGYEVLLDIAADDMPVLHERLYLRMEPSYGKANDGTPIWYPDIPYQVEFREWVEADDPDPTEMDLDAWRDEHRG
jgi:hypothetical protein